MRFVAFRCRLVDDGSHYNIGMRLRGIFEERIGAFMLSAIAAATVGVEAPAGTKALRNLRV
jgi:hypothetical protein